MPPTTDLPPLHPPPARPPARPGAVYRFGACEVRVACHEILVGGVPQPLQPRPFQLLVYLIEQRTRVVTMGELMERVWSDCPVQPGAVAAAVTRVRKAVGDDRHAQLIRTHFRIGYRFVAPLIE